MRQIIAMIALLAYGSSAFAGDDVPPRRQAAGKICVESFAIGGGIPLAGRGRIGRGRAGFLPGVSLQVGRCPTEADQAKEAEIARLEAEKAELLKKLSAAKTDLEAAVEAAEGR